VLRYFESREAVLLELYDRQTSAAYVHLQAEDVRAELVRAGVWPEPERGGRQ
jgi:hypothetical protein